MTSSNPKSAGTKKGQHNLGLFPVSESAETLPDPERHSANKDILACLVEKAHLEVTCLPF